jgi:hypothetical protein
VQVERAARDARGLDHVLDLRAVVAALDEDLQGGLEQLLAAVLPLQARASAVGSN